MAGVENSWVDYYLAVKRGDLEAVRKATDKDCRIRLSLDKSALELAAMYGHVDLFDHFARSMPRTDDYLLVNCVDIALRNGHVEIAEKAIGVLGRVDIVVMSDFDLYDSALESGTLECLKFVHDLLPYSDIKSDRIRQAFEVGSQDALRYIMEIAYLDNVAVANIVGVPIFFVHIALNEMERVWEEIEKNENWPENAWCHRYSEFRTPMDIATMFGQFEILKELVAQMDQEQLSYFRDNVNTTICFALQRNLKNILKYLTEEIAGNRECPCDFPGFMTTDSESDVDDYTLYTSTASCMDAGLSNYCCDIRNIYRDEIDFPSLNIDIRESRIQILPRQKSVRKLLEYLFSKFSNVREHVCFHSEKLFVRFLTQQNVDAALALQRTAEINHKKRIKLLLELKLKHGTWNHLTMCPVIFQLFLERYLYKLQMVGKGIHCKRMLVPIVLDETTGEGVNVVSLKRFLAVNDRYDILLHNRDVVRRSSWDLLIRYYQAILKLCLGSGFIENSGQGIVRIISLLVMYDEYHMKILSVGTLNHLQCCKIDFDDLHHVWIGPRFAWFRTAWPERDEFLTKFLIALSRNGGKRKLHIEFLLTYIIKPDERRRHFLNCLEKTRLSIIDDSMTNGVMDVTPEYLEVQRAILQPKLPTLLELSRSAIHSQCLTVADASCRYGRYSSAEEVVKQVATRFIPNELENWFQYSDIFETLDYEATPSIWTAQ